jgi:hypothetical protein
LVIFSLFFLLIYKIKSKEKRKQEIMLASLEQRDRKKKETNKPQQVLEQLFLS